MATSTGAITSDTQVWPLGTKGIVTYAEAVTAAATIRDGNVSGKVLATIPAGGNVTFDCPIQFQDGLHVAITGGTAVVHIG